MTYYNYIYLDPRKKGKYVYESLCFLYEPIYVGKGTGKRCYSHLQNKIRIDNKKFRNKINKIKEFTENIEDFIILLNFTNNEDIAYENETKLIKEIGSTLIDDIKDGPLVNFCLENKPPSLRGRTYKEIYGDKWEEETEKRRAIQIDRGGYFKDRVHSEESKSKISKSITGDKNPMWGKKHTEQTKRLQREVKMGKNSGKLNYNSKTYRITSPTNEKFIVEGEFKKFCNEYNLSESTVRKTLITKKRVQRGRTKGWIAEYVIKKEL